MHKMYKLSVLFIAMATGIAGCSVAEKKQSDLVFTPTTVAGDERQTELCAVETVTETVVEPALVRPYSTDLYFITNTDILNAESATKAEGIYQNVVRLNSDKIILIGYTDTVGSVESNKALSMLRVEKVKRDLIARGIAADIISIAWHGENYLSVETDDGVDEQKNRRVEIYVR